MKASIVVLILVTSLLCAMPRAVAAPTSADPLETRLLRSVTHRYRHGLPYDVAMSFGPQAVPILTEWLAVDNFKPHYPQIFEHLGYLGGPRETKLVKDFILNRYNRDIDAIELDGVLSAIQALGCISDRDPAALAFLDKATDPQFYTRTRYTNSLRGTDGLHLLLSKLAINAVGTSGRPEADAILRRLEKSPKHPSQVGNISDALEGHAKLMRLGRKAFVESMLPTPVAK